MPIYKGIRDIFIKNIYQKLLFLPFTKGGIQNIMNTAWKSAGENANEQRKMDMVSG